MVGFSILLESEGSSSGFLATWFLEASGAKAPKTHLLMKIMFFRIAAEGGKAKQLLLS